MLFHQIIPLRLVWLTLLLFLLPHFEPLIRKTENKYCNTFRLNTNMGHKISPHGTLTSRPADSEILEAASSLTRAIVSAAPAAASAAARRA